MTTLLLAFALLCAQESKMPSESAPELKKKLEERQAKRPQLEKRIREAIDRGDDPGARALNQEYKDNEKEIDGLQKRLAELKPEKEVWLTDTRLDAQLLLTTFDNGLHLHDGFGFGGALTFGSHLYAEYQRWEADDERGDGEAVLQSYQLGLRGDIGKPELNEVVFTIVTAFGVAHISSSSTGSDSDSGPMLSVRPEFRFYFNSRGSIGLGGDFDCFWTRFNSGHTHARINQSLMFSIEAGF